MLLSTRGSARPVSTGLVQQLLRQTHLEEWCLGAGRWQQWPGQLLADLWRRESGPHVLLPPHEEQRVRAFVPRRRTRGVPLQSWATFDVLDIIYMPMRGFIAARSCKRYPKQLRGYCLTGIQKQRREIPAVLVSSWLHAPRDVSYAKPPARPSRPSRVAEDVVIKPGAILSYMWPNTSAGQRSQSSCAWRHALMLSLSRYVPLSQQLHCLPLACSVDVGSSRRPDSLARQAGTPVPTLNATLTLQLAAVGVEDSVEMLLDAPEIRALPFVGERIAAQVSAVLNAPSSTVVRPL